MASIYIGINRGQLTHPGNVVESGNTNSTDVELRLDTGKGTTKLDVRLALVAIEEWINSPLFDTVFNQI